MDAKRKITVFTPTYNEEENIPLLVRAVKEEFQKIPQYEFEYLIIDNCSTDNTASVLRDLAASDKRIKVILNARNFGHIRSPYYGLMQCYGDAVIAVVADFQDPPEMIPELVRKWEEGYKIVLGVKTKSKENPIVFLVRRIFYKLLSGISGDIEAPVQNFSGFGLYDKKFLDVVRTLEDPYPYFRGMVTELGFQRCEIEYVQPKRRSGKTKNNIFTLYDMAMLGFVNHSKLPLRLSALIGFTTSIVSFTAAVVYLTYKLIYWKSFDLGIAPLVIGLFFFSSVQLFFIGVIGEYIGAIHTQVRKRPLVVEKERINFD